MTRREEIEQQASLTVFPWDDVREQSKFEDGFIEGAKWADKTIIEKAHNWMKANMPNYINFEEGFIYEVDMADDLRKYLEE